MHLQIAHHTSHTSHSLKPPPAAAAAHLARLAAAPVLREVVGGHLAVAARLELLQALQQRRRVKRIRRVKAAGGMAVTFVW